MGHENQEQAPNPFLVSASETIPQASPFASPVITVAEEEGAPSRQELLLRAAELGPPRLTLENIMLAPTDPILGQKMQPRVVERRARFRKFVKVALGACVACTLVGAASSALSSNGSSPTKPAIEAKTAPAMGVVPIEKLDVVAHTKAPRHVTAAVRPAPKWGKRR